MLYLAPGVSQLLLRDESLPNMITEGEFKTLALWRLAIHGSPSRPRFLPLGVSGVYNWRGTIGKTVGPDGSRLDVKGAIPDLDWVAWQGRRVVIAYDAWRSADSLSLRKFLGYALDEATPDHSTISRTRRLYWLETHKAIFRWVLKILEEEELVSGRTVSIDATTLEANAAMKASCGGTTGKATTTI